MIGVDGEWSYASNFDDASVAVGKSQTCQTQLNIIEPGEAKRMLDVFLVIDGMLILFTKKRSKILVFLYK